MGIKEYKMAYVAVLDILGFSNRVDSASCEEIYDLFTEISNTQLKSAIMFENPEDNLPLSKVDKYIMSDTIILSIEQDIPNALSALVYQTMFICSRLLQRDDPILSRGAISQGKYFREDKIMFGPAMIEAYRMEEKIADTPRVILLSSLARCIPEEMERTGFNSSPTYVESDGFICLDYFRMICRPYIPKILKNCEDVIDTSIDMSIRKKYLYIKNRLSQIKNKQDE